MINKASGVTESERVLAAFCERTFLKLWSYPNPRKDDGKELCDLLAVFGDYVFVFFDRERRLPETSDEDSSVHWDRWKRKVVDSQINTAHGAERYIRDGRPIFLDANQTTPFPLEIDPQNAIIHKVVVAHGAKEACERASDQNIYGSLAIIYSNPDDIPTPPFHIPTPPFQIMIDKRKPVHILDSHNLSIVLSELDTITDFADYLDEKLRAILKFDCLMYCGEEDLLGHYLLNYDSATKQHIIGTMQDDVNDLMIGEGEWHDFINTDIYRNTKKKNRISYIWDELIQRTCQNALDGTLGGNSDLLRTPSAIFEMVKEPRLFRRAIAECIKQTIDNFPDHEDQRTRQVSLLPSYHPNVGYVFFQLRMPADFRAKPDYRDKRQTLLEIACGAAKNNFPHLAKVIGIGIDAPKFAGNTNSEDFILLPCEAWTDEMRAYYEELNTEWKFFETQKLKKYHERISKFVAPSAATASTVRRGSKIGRNEPCPCGSGKKHKKCHGA